jgi:hypothetical protein
MFRVTRSRGKTLQSGGFGVVVAVRLDDEGQEIFTTLMREEEEEGEEDDDNEAEDAQEGSPTTEYQSPGDIENGRHNNSPPQDSEPADGIKPKPKAKKVFDYLFLEEVILLSEQGLLECYPDPREQGSDQNPTPLSSSQLYALLDSLQVPMASYLTYAHLRQQTFRVMRYAPRRLPLLQELQECPFSISSKQFRSLKLKLRRNLQQSPPPTVFDNSITQIATPTTTGTSASVENESPQIQPQPQFAYCVYPPDSQFSRSNPGQPAFLVVVTYFGQSTLTFFTLLHLLELANGIPVKIATVADSGAVVMFGISDFGAPTISDSKKS